MKETGRTKLREELTARLIPALRERGFRGPGRISGNALLHGFRRPKGNLTHVLSIQLDKHQRPRFVLNLHVEPPEGLDAVIARRGTIVAGRLSPTRGDVARWFRADRPWWQRLFGITATRKKEAVLAVLAMLDEIERWWDAPARSEHIRMMSVTYRKQDAPGRT